MYTDSYISASTIGWEIANMSQETDQTSQRKIVDEDTTHQTLVHLITLKKYDHRKAST